MIVPTIVSVFVAAPPMLLLATYSAEVMAGLRPLTARVAAVRPARVVVLVPAHDEAAGIATTIAALRLAIDATTELLVVADNCSDDTAVRARHAGARVVERHDPARRGKGYALAYGRDSMIGSPPDCVIVIDADCAVNAGSIDALAGASLASGRAVQACYLQRPNLAASSKAQISSFAFLVKNLVRQRGMTRIGGVAAMTGTGMAFPWNLLVDAPLASADLAEDMALGAWLVGIGKPPLFLEVARVWSDAASTEALMTQRHRWEHGFMTIARRRALPLVAHGLAKRSRSMVWLGLHLLVPPLALLLACSAAALIALLLLMAVGASPVVAAAFAVILFVVVAATVAAWHSDGRSQISGRALLGVPRYIASKLPLYRAMMRRGAQDGWVRTRRAGDDD